AGGCAFRPGRGAAPGRGRKSRVRAQSSTRKEPPMKAYVRSSVTLLFAIAALAVPAGASAAPASTTFAIAGNEYAFTSTVGSFAGTGQGNAGDRAVWNTSVQHDPLGSVPTYVNGGSFQMVTSSPAGHVDSVTGTFVHHGGTIT